MCMFVFIVWLYADDDGCVVQVVLCVLVLVVVKQANKRWLPFIDSVSVEWWLLPGSRATRMASELIDAGWVCS